MQAVIRRSMAEVLSTRLLPGPETAPTDGAQSNGSQIQVSHDVPLKKSVSGEPPPRRSGPTRGAAGKGGQPLNYYLNDHKLNRQREIDDRRKEDTLITSHNL